jgi:hypothetical protein
MSRYRKIEVRTWSDDSFKALTPLPPCGQALWFFLLTGPHTGPIPGLYRAGRAAMAEELNWDLDDFDKAFKELVDLSMVVAEFGSKLIWLPNAIKHNKPESPNVVRHWRVELDLLPECPLKRRALDEMRAVLMEIGPAYVTAFDEVTGAKAFQKPSAKPFPEAFQEPSGESGTGAETEAAAEAGQSPARAPTDSGLQAARTGTQQATPAELSIAMRKLGVMAQPANPMLIELASQGVTTDTVQAACEVAKEALGPHQRIPPAYVINIIRRWAAEARAIDVGGAQPPKRASPGAGNARDTSRMAAAASIGLGSTHGREHTIIDIN